jgi:hypothetical protein
MKTNHLVKFMLASLLVIWVATGNASFTGKCKKVCTKAATTAVKVKTTAAKHFSPLDVVKW